MIETTYILKSPSVSLIPAASPMNERELREFALQLVQTADKTADETWHDKIKKDPIESLVEWLGDAGYEIETHEQTKTQE